MPQEEASLPFWPVVEAKVRNHNQKKNLEGTFSSFELLKNLSEDSNNCQILPCHRLNLS